MTRKSPFRHRVRTYKKHNGTVVDNYMRGEGEAQIADPNIKHTSSSSNYTVYINYLDMSAKETIPVTADNYQSAIQQAMSLRHNIDTPTVVEATIT